MWSCVDSIQSLTWMLNVKGSQRCSSVWLYHFFTLNLLAHVWSISVGYSNVSHCITSSFQAEIPEVPHDDAERRLHMRDYLATVDTSVSLPKAVDVLCHNYLVWLNIHSYVATILGGYWGTEESCEEVSQRRSSSSSFTAAVCWKTGV